MAADSEHPVPWVLAVVTLRAAEDGDLLAVEEHVGHLLGGVGPADGDSTPGRCPPLTSTHGGPNRWMRRATSAMASTSRTSGEGTPASRAASHRLGVTIRAWGSRRSR